MNVKSVWLGGLVVTLLGLGIVRGQGPAMPAGDTSGMRLPPYSSGVLTPISPSGSPNFVPPVPAKAGLSDWILGRRPCGCCGPIGANGPIGAEVYVRSGISFPVGGGIFSKTLDAGWDIEGGVRTMFFNKAEDAAWVIDLGIGNVINPGTTNGKVVGLSNITLETPSPIPGQPGTPVLTPNVNVTVKNQNRTTLNMAIGREIFLLGNAENSREETNWRIGADFGGRWGTNKVELNEIRHRNSSIAGMFVAIHSDVEIPVGSLIFFGGIRGEWSYTWNEILQTQNNSENEDLNLLFTVGVRF